MSPADSVVDVGDRDVLRVQFGRRMGRLYLDVRFWMLDRDTNRLVASRRGIQIPAMHITAVIAALERIRQQMIREGALEAEEGRPDRFRPDVYDADF